MRLAASIRRLTAFNAGTMTGPGTNTWILGEDEVAVLDPGPASREHIENIRNKAPGEVRWILVTHTHPDHSPGAAILAELTGASLIGPPPPPGERQDQSFSPAVQPKDGQEFDLGGFSLTAVHTPGHASNHVCWWHPPQGVLFTGDHIMQGSTVVIAPPDGDMSAYMASLGRLLDLPLRAMAPGHGHWIDRPREEIRELIAHRERRESKVVWAMDALGPATLEAILTRVYDDVPGRLHPVAALSLEAHLLKLERDGLVVSESGSWRLAAGAAP
ncbi:MAG: MBL fold metallo-hydrolase [Gammaproteobacteria bacterium]|nr:MBL fold metallo-hydrolase [Gammaproteobacteria bacterium]